MFRVDAVSLLSIFLAALWLIPQEWVLPGGGAVARPAILIGTSIAVLYAGSRLLPALVPSGRNNVAFGFWAYVWIVAVSFAMSSNRDQFSEELTGGQRELILTIAMVGVGLMVSSSISSRQRLETLLKRLVGLAGIVAVLAVLEFYAGIDIVARVKYPGLELNDGVLPRGSPRSGFSRALATTAHPIELGVVMAMMLPLALHYAFHEADRRQRHFFWASAGAIAATLPTTLTRSSVVAVVISLGTLASIWSRKLLLRMFLVGAIVTAAIKATSPILLGSVLSLFKSLDTDTSISGRTNDYNQVFDFVSQRPLLGRGAGTWGSDTYLLLDNQMLLSLLEIGWIGVTAVSVMYLSGAFVARTVSLEAPDSATKHLAQAIMGSILSAYAILFFVNGFFYEIYFGTTVVLIGSAGALRRLTRDQSAPQRPTDRPHEQGLLARRFSSGGRPRWWKLALGE